MKYVKRDLVSGAGADRIIRRRRRHDPGLKRQIVEETLSGNESVSEVARRHDVNANQLFRWRKQYREGCLASSRTDVSALMPVVVSEPTLVEPLPCLEVDLGNGRRLVMRGGPSVNILRTVLEALR